MDKVWSELIKKIAAAFRFGIVMRRIAINEQHDWHPSSASVFLAWATASFLNVASSSFLSFPTLLQIKAKQGKSFCFLLGEFKVGGGKGGGTPNELVSPFVFSYSLFFCFCFLCESARSVHKQDF